jgi:iron-sulfur cluster repair protein YtfE (RIC family)
MDTPDAAQPLPRAAPGSVERLVTDEHLEIRAHLSHLRELAIALPELDEATASQGATAVLDFLRNVLLPHASAEEASLYPTIDRLVGIGATQTMTLDHQAIASMIEQLGTAVSADAGPASRADMQRLLFVLEAFVVTHLWKEDTAYVPLLARLDSHAYTALHAEVAGHTAHREHTH